MNGIADSDDNSSSKNIHLNLHLAASLFIWQVQIRVHCLAVQYINILFGFILIALIMSCFQVHVAAVFSEKCDCYRVANS